MPDYPRDDVVACAGTGAACLLIHRSTLERMRARFGDVWFDPITHPKGGGTTFSEDFSFCVRLAALDIQLWVNTAAKTTHDKGGVFLDEEAFDRQQRATRADAAAFCAAWSALFATPTSKAHVAA